MLEDEGMREGSVEKRPLDLYRKLLYSMHGLDTKNAVQNPPFRDVLFGTEIHFADEG